MVGNYKLENIKRKELALREKRRAIIESTPEQALDMILSDQTPASLVQSFSAEDLYFLVHHIGIADSIQVLALATSEQWGYMVDVEVWGKDRLDLVSLTDWLKVLLVADDRRTVRWLVEERLEFIELYLFRNIEMIVREENQDPSDFPDDFFTYDDYFYIRIVDNPVWAIPEDGTEEESPEERKLTVKSFIESLVAADITLYQKVMLESASVLSAEIEEEEYRLRNVRLAEKGFMPFDDALEIYSPLTEDYFDTPLNKGVAKSETNDDKYNVPVTYITELSNQNNFTDALIAINSEADLEILQMEFASLCNHVISADNLRVNDRRVLKGVVEKAGGYLSLGMEILLEKSDINPAALIMANGLKDIFRLGFGRVMSLKWEAEKFRNSSWFNESKLPLSFWGENWVGVLGGLMVSRPLFYDNYENGVLYRDFKTLKDVEHILDELKTIRLFDSLLSMISPDIKPYSEHFLTCYNLLLTLWINNLCGRSVEESCPVGIEEFRPLFDGLWETGIRNFENPGKIKISAREEFLNWLADVSGFTEVEIADRLGSGLEAMFGDIEQEYGGVQSKDIDPKMMFLFCLQRTAL